MTNLFISVLLTTASILYPPQESLTEQIESLNREMEEAFQRGDMEAVASFYLEDAIMLSPQTEPVRGSEIKAYWKNIQHPVSWDLEVIDVTADEQEIYQNEFYKALDPKPMSWRKMGLRTETDNQGLVYQLGRSTLVTGTEGNRNESVVNFILVWKYTPDGYRILVDTYSW
jgi:ketosteroid isomerase-like protein